MGEKMLIKPIEEYRRIVKYEQKRRQVGERALEAVKDSLPSETQTQYNQRDIEKRRLNAQWDRGGINE